MSKNNNIGFILVGFIMLIIVIFTFVFFAQSKKKPRARIMKKDPKTQKITFEAYTNYMIGKGIDNDTVDKIYKARYAEDPFGLDNTAVRDSEKQQLKDRIDTMTATYRTTHKLDTETLPHDYPDRLLEKIVNELAEKLEKRRSMMFRTILIHRIRMGLMSRNDILPTDELTDESIDNLVRHHMETLDDEEVILLDKLMQEVVSCESCAKIAQLENYKDLTDDQKKELFTGIGKEKLRLVLGMKPLKESYDNLVIRAENDFSKLLGSINNYAPTVSDINVASVSLPELGYDKFDKFIPIDIDFSDGITDDKKQVIKTFILWAEIDRLVADYQ